MPMVPNFLVEVRNRNFVRVGQIAHEYLNLKFTEVYRGIGAWTLKVPAEHPLLADLREKGSGIIVTETFASGSRVYSGRMRTAMLSQAADDPAGTWEISGSDDGLIASATVVYPDPANLASAQNFGYWNYAGAGETVMKQAVALNAGQTAIVSRKYPWLTVTPDLARGTGASANARFDVLGELLQVIGTQSGLGWKFYQSGDSIVFDVTVQKDLTSEVRLDIRNGGLESSELGYSAPSATEVLVLGQGEGAARTVRPVSSVLSRAEAVLWGLRWEATKDQRNTDVAAELQNAGEEILSENGNTVHSLKVIPSGAPGQRIGEDWGLGDKVTVVIDGQEAQAVVAQIATSISSEGAIRQATVGDPVGYDWDAKVGSKLTSQGRRIDRLETYVDAAASPGSNLPTGSSLEGHWTVAPAGFLLENGAVYTRDTYPALFTVLGTRYNTGGETTSQFRVPDSRGRVGVGKAASGTFATLGGKSGAETHTLSVAEMPSHAHTQSLGGGITTVAPSGGSGIIGTANNSPVSSTGGGQAHNNVQPSLVVLRVIKI